MHTPTDPTRGRPTLKRKQRDTTMLVSLLFRYTERRNESVDETADLERISTQFIKKRAQAKQHVSDGNCVFFACAAFVRICVFSTKCVTDVIVISTDKGQISSIVAQTFNVIKLL